MTFFYKFIAGLSLCACLFVSSASAQKVGKFDTLVTFMDTTRKLACYAPTDYDPSKAYRLIVGLHGLGDNAVNYRNALVSLGWPTNFPNTIFVCPEAASVNDDFYAPVGGEAIVQRCMDYAMSTYHIDTANVILNGFSLGGRAALRYGLENPEKFKGLLLNTPALQGVKNALNEQPFYLYKYENASKLPIYITHGANDVFYTAPIDTAFKLMVLQDGKVVLNRVPKLAHTIPTFKQMPNVVQFFEMPALVPNDVQLVEIQAPVRTCTKEVRPLLLIRNLGSDTASIVKIKYGANGYTPNTTTEFLHLAPFSHRYVYTDLVLQDGRNSISAYVAEVNGVPDTSASNNYAEDTLEVALTSKPLPFAESFSGSFPPAGWTFERSGDYLAGFDIDSETGSDDDGSMTAFNSIFIVDNLGKEDAILTPALDLTTLAQPSLSFDMAFNFHRYTPPYFTDTVDFADTLEVEISTDCGDTWQQLFRKGGTDLATFEEPIMNPLSVEQDFISPEASDWKRQLVDLSNYVTATSAVIKFNYISALGGHLYIDNVRVQGPAAVSTVASTAIASIYPNPSTDRLTINGLSTNAYVRVLDIMGRQVMSASSESTELSLDVQSLPAGNYVLQISSDGNARFEKFGIQR